MAPEKRLLVAIPCLNEGATVARVIRDIPRDIPGIKAVTVLVIDDGSTDDTTAEAKAAGAHVASHGDNRGVGAAFQTALAYAVQNGFDVMCNIDADGQFDPLDIPRLVRVIVDGEADFVSASRFVDPSFTPAEMPWLKRWGNARMSSLVSGLAGHRFHDVSCGFRAYSREAMLQLNLHGRFTYTQETFLDLAFKGLRIRELPVKVTYFKDRKSRVAGNLLKYAQRASTIIFRLYRDYHPLRFFWAIAAFAFLLGAGFGSILLYHYVTTGMFTGQIWSGFVGAGFLAIGVVFVVVGVVADMLGCIRVNQERLLYLLKKGQGADHRVLASVAREPAPPAAVHMVNR
jgi:glycosyltransferase involved in cell wall biosynthesis